jgi:hypothetical protein
MATKKKTYNTVKLADARANIAKGRRDKAAKKKASSDIKPKAKE